MMKQHQYEIKNEKFIKKIFSNKSGVTAVEAALIIPLLFALVLYIVELMFLNSAKAALMAITVQATADITDGKGINRFYNIIEKYKKKYAPRGEIDYYIRSFESPEYFLHNAGEVYWPKDSKLYLDKNKDTTKAEDSHGTDGLPDNDRRFFVITFVTNYKFSNRLMRLFFSGGTNTTRDDNNPKTGDPKGSEYLIYARGVGVLK